MFMKNLRDLIFLGVSMLISMSLNAQEVISIDAESAGLSPKQIKLLDLIQGREYSDAKELLRNYKVNERTKRGITLLWWTANLGDYENFIFLLENGASPLNQTLDTYNIMELCAAQEDSRFLNAALEKGGSANLISYHRRATPIFTAVKYHNVENVETLLDAGAATNIADNIGRTPALWAAEFNAFEILVLLLKAGADPAIKDIWGLNVFESLKEKELESANPQLSYLKEAINLIEEKKKGTGEGGQ